MGVGSVACCTALVLMRCWLCVNSKNVSERTAPCYTCGSVCHRHPTVLVPSRGLHRQSALRKNRLGIRNREQVHHGLRHLRRQTLGARHLIGTLTVQRFRSSLMIDWLATLHPLLIGFDWMPFPKLIFNWLNA